MRRKIERHLLDWKNREHKIPLLMRGARQVGKSYIIEAFGKAHFKNILSVNFELMPNIKECFKTVNPPDIINKLQLLFNAPIDKDTLLFLDEIQECPSAILSLRYFKEKMPEQPVIGAGSLMEFAFKQEDFRLPVGRIQFLNLEPLSFSEFLEVSGNTGLKEYLSGITHKRSIDSVIHDRLLELLRIYLVIGGMPEGVNDYIKTGDILNCQRIQTGLLETYRKDFGKYANLSHHKYLQKVFDAVPRLAGQRIKYVNIDRETKSRDLKNAVELLSLARVVRPIYASKASGLPLGAQSEKQKFKLAFIDIGLMQKACGLQAETQTEINIMRINAGAAAEQFAAQELKAYMDPYQENQLYFWTRDKHGSMAEVDYLFTKDKYILPIEVKAGKAGTLKSLYLFLKQKKAPMGIRFSTDNISFYNNILSVPLYAIEQLSRLLDTLL